MPRMEMTQSTKRQTMRAAHAHYRRMAASHPDWPFAASLRIEHGKSRSIPSQMARIRAAIERPEE